MNEIKELFFTHWGFATVLIFLTLAGQVMKSQVFTFQLSAESKIIDFGRRTQALHPVLVGALAGCIPGMPTPGEFNFIEGVLYYALAGTISVFFFSFASDWAKKRGYELDLPGDSIPPKKPE